MTLIMELLPFSNEVGDGNENVKKLESKTRTPHAHRAFLFISLPPLHDYNMKFPDRPFYGIRKHTTAKFSLSFY